MKPYITAGEMAKLLKVDRATVTRWISKGVISQAARAPKSGYWRIPVTVVEKMLRSQHEGR